MMPRKVCQMDYIAAFHINTRSKIRKLALKYHNIGIITKDGLRHEEFFRHLFPYLKQILATIKQHARRIFNTLRSRQNGRHSADDPFWLILFCGYVLMPISLNFVAKVSIEYNPALVQILAWCRPGDKPLS